jgi:acyl-CoA thioester hydrolase
VQAPLLPTAFPVLLDEPPRYSDLDSSRRIGRDALVRWFEDARVAMEYRYRGTDLTTNAPGPVRMLLASVSLEVIAPLTVAGRYRVGVGISHLGRSSVAHRYGVFAGERCVAVGESVAVHADAHGPVALTDDRRALWETLRVADEPADRPAPDPERLRREAYPFRVDVRARFTDIDTNRHVNNVALARWYLDGLAELHLDVLGYPVGGPLDGLSPSSLRVQYRAEVHYPGTYQLRAGVQEIDGGTVRYVFGLFDGPRCIGLAEAEGAHRVGSSESAGAEVDLAARLTPFALRRE